MYLFTLFVVVEISLKQTYLYLREVQSILTSLEENVCMYPITDGFPEQTKTTIYDHMDEFPERFVLYPQSFEYFRETSFSFPVFLY